jgi:hypothetical protein
MTAPDYFVPQQKTIFWILRGSPTIVATVGPHNYQSGLVVRIDVPMAEATNGQPPTSLTSSRGMTQINGLIGQITVTGTNFFSIPIDSRKFDPYVFIFDPRDYQYVGQVIPVAEDALTLTSATKNNYTIRPEIYGTPPAPQTI